MHIAVLRGHKACARVLAAAKADVLRLIYVKTSGTSEKIPIELDSDSIDDLRKKIHAKMGILPQEQELITGRRFIENEDAMKLFAASMVASMNNLLRERESVAGGGSGGGGGYGGGGGGGFGGSGALDASPTRRTLSDYFIQNEDVIILRKIKVPSVAFCEIGDDRSPMVMIGGGGCAQA